MMMKSSSRLTCNWLFTILLLLLFFIAYATGRFSQQVSVHADEQEKVSSITSNGWKPKKEMMKEKQRGAVVDEERLFRLIKGKLGSSPPSCERKCGGCSPCAAIQVPTITDRFRPQLANYEPEGWKCKCGSVFFNP